MRSQPRSAVGEAERLLDAGALAGGIVPKLRAAVGATRQGVDSDDRRHGGAGMSSTLDLSALLPTYARYDVTFASGDGVWLTDVEGRRYLDLLGGIAVVSLGHCHPAPLAAAQRQLTALWHTSNLYSTEPMQQLAGRLSDRFGGARAFFCNSGTEAVEAGTEVGAEGDGQAGRRRARELFHGRTHGALAVTGQPAKRAPWEPLAPAVALRAT